MATLLLGGRFPVVLFAVEGSMVAIAPELRLTPRDEREIRDALETLGLDIPWHPLHREKIFEAVLELLDEMERRLEKIG